MSIGTLETGISVKVRPPQEPEDLVSPAKAQLVPVYYSMHINMFPKKKLLDTNEAGIVGKENPNGLDHEALQTAEGNTILLAALIHQMFKKIKSMLATKGS